MTDFTPHTARFSGRRVFIILVAFFSVIISVNALMLVLAVKNFGGLVVKNSYVASQTFNEDVATAKAQPIRGWTLDLTVDADTVQVTVLDQDHSPLTDLELSLTLDRPTHQRSTTVVTLSETEPGRYIGEVSLDPGKWVGTLYTGDGQARSIELVRPENAS